jgi:hypothetical protein
LRFGQRVRLDDVPTIPERYRGLVTPGARLFSVRLRPATGEAWLRLRAREMRRPWKRPIRTIPLKRTQSPTPEPVPDVIELQGGMQAFCHDGYVGRVDGLVIQPGTGLATELLVRVRGDILAAIDASNDRLAVLMRVQGQPLMLPVAWAVSTKREPAGLPVPGERVILQLDASAEQVASGIGLRGDGDIAAEAWRMLEANPALAPHAGHLRVVVRDGELTLLGQVPTPRHRASAEQDVWHIPGVLAVRNRLVVAPR